MAKRYFAILGGKGRNLYATTLDYYPEEEALYRQEEGSDIVGDFATAEEAQEAARKALLDAWAKWKASTKR